MATTNKRKRTAGTTAIAADLGISTRMVQQLIAHGTLHATKSGGRWMLNKAECRSAYTQSSAGNDHGGNRAGAGAKKKKKKTTTRSERTKRGKKTTKKQPTPPATDPDPTSPDPDDGAVRFGGLTKAQLQIAIGQRKVKLYDLKIAREMGTLIDATEARKTYTSKVTAASRLLNGLGRSCAAVIVAELELPTENIPIIDLKIREQVSRVVTVLKAGKLGGPEDV